MYRTAFGFSPEAGGMETATALPQRARRSMVLALSVVPFAVSGVFAAVSPHHAKQLWLFSCRLFGH